MMFDVLTTLAAALLGCFLLLRWLMACGLGLPIEESFFTLQSYPSPSSSRPPGVPGEKAICRRENVKLFCIALSFRVALLLLSGLILLFLAGNGETTSLRDAWLQGDGYHYVQLVERGYSGYTENGEHLFLVFFPLYVWVTRAVNVLIGDAFLSGLTVSFLCYSGACVFVYRLAREELNRRAAQRAVVFLSVFPFSFFFGGMMTESLFLLTTSASLLYIRRHRWAAAGVWGMLAAMTRMHGVLMAAVAMIELFENLKVLEADGRGLKKRIFPVLRQLPFLCLPFLGTGVYLLLNYWVDGNPFAFVIHQQHWHQGFSWFSQTLQYVGENAFAWEDLSTRAAIWIPQLVLFVIFAALLALCWKKLPSMYTLYGFFYLVLNYSLSWLLSAGRYLSCGIPFFLFAALLTEKRPSLDKGLTAAMAALLGVYLFAWLSGAAIY